MLGNLDSILKSRDITFPKKVCLVKAMVFPVVMYGCESWTKKKAELWKTDTFELWCRRRLFRIPWTARRTNQSILKEISLRIIIGRTDAEAETPILWPPDAKNWLTGKEPDARQDGRQEEKGTTEDEMVGWHHWLDGHEFAWAPEVGDGQGSLTPFHGVSKSQTQLSDWTELKQALHSVPLALVLFSLMGWNFQSPQHSHLPGLFFLTSQTINFMFSPFLVSYPCFSGEHPQVISS